MCGLQVEPSGCGLHGEPSGCGQQVKPPGSPAPLTWCSRHPGELHQTLCLADHHFDPLGQGLVLQQDEQLAQGPAERCGAPPSGQQVLRAQALSEGREQEEQEVHQADVSCLYGKGEREGRLST